MVEYSQIVSFLVGGMSGLAFALGVLSVTR